MELFPKNGANRFLNALSISPPDSSFAPLWFARGINGTPAIMHMLQGGGRVFSAKERACEYTVGSRF
eukprot:25220-Amphidinium_carterae.1